MLKTELELLPSCRSECDTLQVVAVCRPASLAVETAEEADYVSFRAPVSPARALEAYQRLTEALQENQVTVLSLETYMTAEERHLSDQLVNRAYTRDAGAVCGGQLIFGSACIDVRKPDFRLAQAALERLVPYDAIVRPSLPPGGSIEFGDFMMLNQHAVLLNVGWRTNRDGADALCRLLFNEGYEEVGQIVLPRDISTPHMDVVCNLLGREHFLAAPFLRHVPVEIHSPDGSCRYMMLPDFLRRHGYQIIWLPPGQDALGYTNFLHLNAETILACDSSVGLPGLLRGTKMELIPIDVKELERGGGGIRCLTLPLCRA